MSQILAEILASTRQEVERRRHVVPVEALAERARAAQAPRGFGRALTKKPIACIAEFKRKSPSQGWIRQGADPAEIGAGYQAAGAAALSVLTDEPFFGGTLADLAAARAAVEVPVLRKDFMLDPYQVVEARAAGADAILLIVSALGDQEMAVLMAEATRWGMDTLVETHDEAEIARAVAIGAALIGINHRDLRTFQVDTTLAIRMRDRIPSGRIVVAESGIKSPADVQRLRAAGIEAILVGESLMRAPSPADALRGLLAVPA